MLGAAAVAVLGTTAATSTAPSDGFTVSGRQVQLTTASGSAPMLQPGLYKSTLPADDTVRYGSVTRSPGETLAVSVAGRPASPDGRLNGDQHLTVSLVTAGGDKCAENDSYLDEDDPTAPIVSTALLDGSETKRSFYISDDCKSATRLRVEVSRKGSGGSSSPLPVEVLVTAEPRVTGKPKPAAAEADLTTLTAPSLHTTTTVDGGHGFSDAPTVSEGSVLTDLRLGSATFFRVRVGWGQRLAVSLEAPRNGSSFAPPYDASTDITVWSPERLSAGSSYGGDLSASSTIDKQDGEPQTSGSFTAPVRFANRDAESPSFGQLDTDEYQSASVAGWYYIEVLTQAGSDDEPATSATPIPARLNVEVTGTAQSGPDYVAANGAAISAPPPGRLSVGGDSSSVPWGRIGGGSAAVVLAGGACLWALRARRRSARTSPQHS